jgi:opacity protein-like surface antigen
MLVSLAAFVAAGPALAQSADTNSWTGFYAGARAGWNFQPKDNDEIIAYDTNLDGNYGDTVRTSAGANAFSPGNCGGYARGASPASGCKKDRGGLEWAVHAGYDYDLGGPVIGVVGEFGAGYAEDAVSSFSTTPASYTMIRTQKFTYGLRARAGYAFGAQRDTLVYATAGGVRAKMHNDFRTTNTANSFTLGGDTKAWGYRVGAGVERRVDPHLTIGLQYLLTSIDDDGGSVRAGPGTAPATNPFRLVNANGTDFRRTGSDFNSHSIGVTANVRF